MKKLLKSALVIAFAGAMAAGCSTTYSRDDLIKDLKANGTSDTVAVCSADELDKQGIKVEKYSSSEPDPKVVNIVAQCLAKEAGVTLPSSIPAG